VRHTGTRAGWPVRGSVGGTRRVRPTFAGSSDAWYANIATSVAFRFTLSKLILS
jgi:hypothetical protein